MPRVPSNNGKRIAFYAERVEKWAQHYAQIGLSEAEVAEVAALAAEARDLLTAQGIAMGQARSATLALNRKMKELHTRGGGAITKIRVQAAITGGTEVFSLSNTAPAKAPSPVGPPGQPQRLEVVLLVGGELELRWACDNPVSGGGTVYEIRRATSPTTGWASVPEFTTIGHAGAEKTFVDRTLPVGCGLVAYQITGIRGSRRGAANLFTVQFGAVEGVGAGGARVKLAA